MGGVAVPGRRFGTCRDARPMVESTTQIDTGGMDDDGEGFDPAVTTLSVAAVRGREPRAVDDLLEPAVIARLLRDPSEVYTAVRQLHLVSWSAPELMHDHLPALLAALSTTDNLSVRLEVLLSLVNFSADQPGARAIVKAGGLPQLSRQLIVAVSATGAEAQCVPPLCAALRNLAVEPETCLRIAEARCVPPLLKVLPSKAVPWEARHDALLVLWQVHACALHAHHTPTCKHGTLHSYSALIQRCLCLGSSRRAMRAWGCCCVMVRRTLCPACSTPPSRAAAARTRQVARWARQVARRAAWLEARASGR